ncbi:MAG TPA: porin family protein [Pedobacter sp.]|nr:porin family protein [Pedobacter sp.]
MKRTFIGLVFLFFAGSLQAQEAGNGYGFRLGLTAHPTVGWVKPQVGKSNGVSLGFSYGLLADFNFAENYSFSTGLTITTINGKSTEVMVSPSPSSEFPNPPQQSAYELKYKLQYIELPLTLKLRTVQIGDIRWYGQFGLSNDFNIGAKQDAEVSGNAGYKDVNVSDYIKFYRAGLIIGAGAEFDLNGKQSITTGLTYNNGFTDISTDDQTSIRNHYVGINFGVFF